MRISVNIFSTLAITSICMFGGVSAVHAQVLNSGGVVFGQAGTPAPEEPAPVQVPEGEAVAGEDGAVEAVAPVDPGIIFLKPPVAGSSVPVVVEQPQPVVDPAVEGTDGTVEGGGDVEVPVELGIVFVKPPINGFRAPTTLSADMFQLRQEVLSLIAAVEPQTLMEVRELQPAERLNDLETYQIDLIAHMLLLDGKLAEAAGDLGLPAVVNDVSLNMQASFSHGAPQAASSGPRYLSNVDLAAIHLNWGGVEILGKGLIEVDENGMLNGEVAITATPWRLLLELQGINEAQRTTLGLILEGMSDGETLSVPLVVADSNLTVGPIFLTKIPPVAW